MFNINITEILISAFVFLFALTVHEYSHGLVSTLQGDDTPERYGRLTMNPLAHIDIIGFITLLIFHFGWAKPVPISSRNYKNPRLGIILTSLAGPFSNILISFISIIVWHVLPESLFIKFSLLDTFLFYMAYVNAMLAVFNIIPIPPLDGSKIFAEIFGGKVSQIIYSMERYGIFILLALLWIKKVQDLLSISIWGVIGFLEKIVLLFV
jgi:Zn-dependent protease